MNFFSAQGKNKGNRRNIRCRWPFFFLHINRMERLRICSLTPHSPWSPKANPHHTDSYKLPYGHYYFCSFHQGFWCCLRQQNTVHIEKSWLITLLWHAQASFVPHRWMLILSILEEAARSGERRKENNAAVHSLVRWQRQLSSAALTQLTHEKTQMLKNSPQLFFSHSSWWLLL